MFAQPGAGEFFTAVLGEDAVDGGMVGFGRGGAESQRYWPEAQFEQPIAATRLAVIVALGRGAGDDLDLAVVETELAIDRGDLRLDGALVGQEDPRRSRCWLP